MRTKKTWFILAIAVFVFVQMGALGFATDNKYTRLTLRGIKGIHVMVEALEPEIEKDGLTRQQIQTDMELKLRLAGIRVLTPEEMLKGKGVPWLYVNANIRKLMGIKSYVYCVSLEFNQSVYLARNSSVPYRAVTWSTGSMGKTSKFSTIRDAVKDKVDKFINAYLSVNPK